MNFYLLFPFIPKKYKYSCPYNLRKQGLVIANFTCILVSASAYKKNQGKIIWRTGQLELSPANYKVNVTVIQIIPIKMINGFVWDGSL